MRKRRRRTQYFRHIVSFLPGTLEAVNNRKKSGGKNSYFCSTGHKELLRRRENREGEEGKEGREGLGFWIVWAQLYLLLAHWHGCLVKKWQLSKQKNHLQIFPLGNTWKCYFGGGLSFPLFFPWRSIGPYECRFIKFHACSSEEVTRGGKSSHENVPSATINNTFFESIKFLFFQVHLISKIFFLFENGKRLSIFCVSFSFSGPKFDYDKKSANIFGLMRQMPTRWLKISLL